MYWSAPLQRAPHPRALGRSASKLDKMPYTPDGALRELH